MYSPIQINNKQPKNRKFLRSIKKFFKFVLFWFLAILPFAFWRLYVVVIKPLPEITPDKLQDLSLFSQSSSITDKNWEVLYKLFEENRKRLDDYLKLQDTKLDSYKHKASADYTTAEH